MYKDAILKYSQGSKIVGKTHKTLVSVLTGSTSKSDLSRQLKKIETISKLDDFYIPDIISDLSLSSSNSNLYKELLTNYPQYIVTTLPIYQSTQYKVDSIDKANLLDVVEEQIASGVGMITIHPTPNKNLIKLSKSRLVPVTSRGGVIVIKDLVRHNKSDNVYLEILDDIVSLCFLNKVTISIGASFRSANIFDSFDDCQVEEFKIQKEIADYISSSGVSVIIEGPGHSTPKKLKLISEYYNKMGYAIMPLGPIPTDVSIGQDHISSSIGASILGIYGCVDIITSVTREEHTGKIPSTESSIEAIIAAKITAHILNLDKTQDYTEDLKIAKFRADNQTCIYGKNTSGCSRCAHVCPLIIE